MIPRGRAAKLQNLFIRNSISYKVKLKKEQQKRKIRKKKP